MEFADGAALRKVRSARPPQLIFLDVGVEAHEAMLALEALGKANFGGAVQLMSSRGAAVLDTARRAGEQHKLHMLPALRSRSKPRPSRRSFFNNKLGRRPPSEVRIPLAEAITNNWIEFWYQPKIDLRKKQLAGAEAFARVNHPQHGILPPANFMPGADDASLLALSEQALVSALKSGLNLSRLGSPAHRHQRLDRPAVKLPVGDIVRAHRPQ